MKRSEKLVKLFFYLMLVVLGIIVGVAFGHYGNLPLAEEINLIDIAGLMVTIFLAVYIPMVLNQQLQTTRDRKKLLEDRILDYQNLIRRVNILIQDKQTRPFDDYLTIKNLLDVSEQRLNTLVLLIKNSGFDSSLNQDIAKIKKINEEHKNLLWDKIEAVSDSDLLEQSIREREELLYNKLDETSSLLIFKISSVK